MKLSEITAADVGSYLRLEKDQVKAHTKQLAAIMEAARRYIESYTGIPIEELDEYDDLWPAFMVLCQDMFDNRSMYPDAKFSGSANRVVESILGMHTRNLL